MTVNELMADITLKPDFTGIQVNDNIVLAIQPPEEKALGLEITADTDVGNWYVSQLGIKGFSPSMNADSITTQYIRSGSNTTKTSQQRKYEVTGDKYWGDDFQDLCLQYSMRYGMGEDVIYGVVVFNIINGVGEIGKFSVLVDNDGGGDAGENSSIAINLEQAGMIPLEYKYKQPTTPVTASTKKAD